MLHPFVLPHESIAEIATAGAFLRAEPDFLALPKVAEDAVMRRFGPDETVFLRLYADAAPVRKSQNSDSFLAIYWTDLATNERFLITVVKKKMCCRVFGLACLSASCV